MVNYFGSGLNPTNNFASYVWPACANYPNVSALNLPIANLQPYQANINLNAANSSFAMGLGWPFYRSLNFVLWPNAGVEINTSSATFTVNGFLNKQPISEVITVTVDNGLFAEAPGIATTQKFYTSISSVVGTANTNGPNNIGIDWGYWGCTPLFLINPESAQLINCSIRATGSGTLTTQLCIGQDDFLAENLAVTNGSISYPWCATVTDKGQQAGSGNSQYYNNVYNGNIVVGRYATINVISGTTSGAGFNGSLYQPFKG